MVQSPCFHHLGFSVFIGQSLTLSKQIWSGMCLAFSDLWNPVWFSMSLADSFSALIKHMRMSIWKSKKDLITNLVIRGESIYTGKWNQVKSNTMVPFSTIQLCLIVVLQICFDDTPTNLLHISTLAGRGISTIFFFRNSISLCMGKSILTNEFEMVITWQ